MIELFEKYVYWRILSRFLASPNTFFHVKGLARMMEVSPGSVSSAARALHSEGLLIKDERGLAHYYKLNADHYFVPPLKKAYGIAKISELKPEIEFLEVDPDITSLALFGSYADGSFDEESDVDFLVITPNKKREVIRTAEQFGSELGLEVGVYMFRLPQWRSMAKRGDEFYRLVVGNYLLLRGDEVE